MGAVAVVVVNVDAEDTLELAAVDDQDPVETLAADRADEALGVGVHLRRPDRRLDDLDPFAAKDFVERRVELGTTLMVRPQPPPRPSGRARLAAGSTSIWFHNRAR